MAPPSVSSTERWLGLAIGSVLMFSPSIIPGASTLVKGYFVVVVAGVLAFWTAIRLYLHRHIRYGPREGRGVRSYSVSLVLVALVLLVHVPNSPSETYGWVKTGEYLLKVLVPASFLLSFGALDQRDIEAVLLGVVVSGLIVAAPILGGRNPYTIIVSERMDTISIGRLLGTSVVAVAAWLSVQEPSRNAIRVILGSAVLVLLAVGLMACGQRGPLIGVLLSIAALVLWPSSHPQSHRSRLSVLLLATLVFGVVVMLLDNPTLFSAGQIGIARIRLALIKIGQEDDAQRWELLRQGISAFRENPWIGVGTGGYLDFFQQHSGYVVGSLDRLYPHNLLLEFAAEEGLVGIVVITATLCHPIGRIAHLRRHSSEYKGCIIGIALFVFVLVNAMVSGDIANNSAVFLWGLVTMQCVGIAEPSGATLPDGAIRARS